MFDIINTLYQENIHLEIVGDPKQDLHGFGNLRKLIEKYPDKVSYIQECYRCPINHLKLSNFIITPRERQISNKKVGDLNIVFESSIKINQFILSSNFDLMYIYKSNESFSTRKAGFKDIAFETLNHDLCDIFTEMYPKTRKYSIARAGYYYTHKLIQIYMITHNVKEAMTKWFTKIYFTEKSYAKIAKSLELVGDKQNNNIRLCSIESIKGEEGKNCLFVLTKDLAAYILGEKNKENKVKNALYVALTRSLERLTILVTAEVEDTYTKHAIIQHLKYILDNEK